MQFKNFDKENFLKNYWEKKPLVIKNAVPNAKELCSTDDLMELAQDPDFETRMIIQSGGEHPWQLKHGPFTADDFNAEGQRTLICHKLNLLDNAFFNLQQMVRFLPNWQFDDVMATLSKDTASCGAHIDNYNVFILQGQGKRLWQLQSNPNTAYQEGLDVRLLQEFTPDTEIILEPGDILYIPPKVAHHGISIGTSISYSIGFRALDYPTYMDFYTSFLMQAEGVNAFFANPAQTALDDPFRISTHDLELIKKDFLKQIVQTHHFDDALCSYLSRATGQIESQDLDKEEVHNLLLEGIPFARDQHSQFLYTGQKLYCNSVPFDLSESNYQKLLPLIAADLEQEFTFDQLQPDQELEEFLKILLVNGDLYFRD